LALALNHFLDHEGSVTTVDTISFQEDLNKFVENTIFLPKQKRNRTKKQSSPTTSHHPLSDISETFSGAVTEKPNSDEEELFSDEEELPPKRKRLAK
jgi:hypothetical protein